MAGITAALALVVFALPVGDPDAFWHVATGRWILEHGALPRTDPLSYMTHAFPLPALEQKRVEFFLQQYWLAQVLMAAAWQLLGHAALALLRMLAWALLLGGMTWWATSRAPARVAVTLAALTATVLVEYPSERPQLATFLLLPLLVSLLDGKRTVVGARWAPLVMLLWANLHGGFLFGLGVTGLYLAGAVVRQLRAPVPGGWQRPLLLAVALLAPGLNPSGYGAITAILGSSRELVGGNLEFLSPVVAARELGFWLPAFWCVLAWAAVSLAANVRRVPVETALVVVGVGALGLSALRFVPLFLGTVAVLAPWLVWPRRLPGWLPAGAAALWLAAGLPSRGWPSVEVAKGFPVGAARALAGAGAPARLFNFYDWGGYLELALPGQRTFIDGRALVDAQKELYNDLLAARGWELAFDRLGIDAAVLPAISPYTGRLLPLAAELVVSPGWQLTFADGDALVFTRTGTQDVGTRAAGPFLDHLRSRLDALQSRVHGRPEYWTTRAVLELNSGNSAEARRAVDEALARKPQDSAAQGISRFLSRPGGEAAGVGGGPAPGDGKLRFKFE